MCLYFSSSLSYLLVFVFSIPQSSVSQPPTDARGFTGLSLTYAHCKTAPNPMLQELPVIVAPAFLNQLDCFFFFFFFSHCCETRALGIAETTESHTQLQVFSEKGTFVESSLRTLLLLQYLAWMCCHFWSYNKLLTKFTLCSSCVLFLRGKSILRISFPLVPLYLSFWHLYQGQYLSKCFT